MFELTVIVPSHNKKAYIGTCLDSIFMQTYPVEEVIVFDDRSSDGTDAILKKYQNKYDKLTVIYSEKNVGVSCARDTAIRMAKTEYVTFVDADDFYSDEKKLEREMQEIQNVFKQTGRLCCAYSQTILVNKDGERTDRLPLWDWDSFLRLGTITRLYKYWIPRDYCFPKSIYLEAGGFDFGIDLYEDWDLNLRMYAKCDFCFSGGYGTSYRLNLSGLSSVDYRKHFRNKRMVFQKNEKILQYTFLEKWIFNVFLYIAFIKSWIKGRLK